MTRIGARWRLVSLALAISMPAACTNGGASTPTIGAPAVTATALPATVPPETEPPQTATPAPAGPPTGSVELTGEEGMAGPVEFSGTTRANGVGIRCNYPSFEGPGIQLFNPSPVDGANISIRIAPAVAGGPAMVMASISSGAGDTYSQRDFVGPGVPDFEPARGATFDAAVLPTGTQTRPEQLGTLTRITGSVDCGGQTAGSTDLTITGTGDGIPSGPIQEASVLCTERDGVEFASILGIVTTGEDRYYLFVTVSNPGIQVVARSESNAFVFYNGTGDTTATTTGGTADSDAASDAGVTIHIAGEATCGNLSG